jgi:soluble lytic murein transglycosylase
MNRCLRSLSCFLAVTGLALFSTDATARTSHKPHTQKAHEATRKSHVKEARPHRSTASGQRRHAKHASAQRKPKPSKASPAPGEAVASLTGDLALVKEAIDLARKAKTKEATAIRDRIGDPAAQKLVEWFILRHVAAPARRGAAVGGA